MFTKFIFFTSSSSWMKFFIKCFWVLHVYRFLFLSLFEGEFILILYFNLFVDPKRFNNLVFMKLKFCFFKFSWWLNFLLRQHKGCEFYLTCCFSLCWSQVDLKSILLYCFTSVLILISALLNWCKVLCEVRSFACTFKLQILFNIIFI